MIRVRNPLYFRFNWRWSPRHSEERAMTFSTRTLSFIVVSFTLSATAAIADPPPKVEMRVIPSRSASRPGGANMNGSPLTPRNRPRPDIFGIGGGNRGGGGGAWTDAA